MNEVKDTEVLQTIFHFHTMFNNYVKPQMEKKYSEQNNGAKLGFHIVDKDGKEKLFDDVIIENGTTQRENGTK